MRVFHDFWKVADRLVGVDAEKKGNSLAHTGLAG
jgi:hypothetical protein